MRITPAMLHKIARDTVAERARRDRSLLAIYLHGSMLGADPLLGGTADIDLFLIHDERVGADREIVRLTDEVHLDIAHHARDDYRQTRALRLHPWLGYGIIKCKIMYDPQHFMDFTQASVRGQFDQPENVLGRARGQADHARQIWLQLHEKSAEPGLEEIDLYLRAVVHAANAIALLTGPPLADRRLLLEFPKRAEAVQRPGLYPGLLGLLGGPNVDREAIQSWLPSWEEAFTSLPPDQAPAGLHADRCAYYQRAFLAIINGDHPQDVLWPVLRTWTSAIRLHPARTPLRESWSEALGQLGLWGLDFGSRLTALDAYLDAIEERLDEWGQARGIE
jgi:hypothetical protein